MGLANIISPFALPEIIIKKDLTCSNTWPVTKHNFFFFIFFCVYAKLDLDYQRPKILLDQGQIAFNNLITSRVAYLFSNSVCFVCVCICIYTYMYRERERDLS